MVQVKAVLVNLVLKERQVIEDLLDLQVTKAHRDYQDQLAMLDLPDNPVQLDHLALKDLKVSKVRKVYKAELDQLVQSEVTAHLGLLAKLDQSVQWDRLDLLVSQVLRD